MTGYTVPTLVHDAAPRLRTPSQPSPKPVSKPEPARSFSRKDALALWHRVTLSTVRDDGPDLSTRQLAMLMTIYLDDGPHTVRSLAARLNVTKAAISRATDRLCAMNFIERKPDPRDKRSVLLERTSGGIHYLSAFADTIQSEWPNG